MFLEVVLSGILLAQMAQIVIVVLIYQQCKVAGQANLPHGNQVVNGNVGAEADGNVMDGAVRGVGASGGAVRGDGDGDGGGVVVGAGHSHARENLQFTISFTPNLVRIKSFCSL